MTCFLTTPKLAVHLPLGVAVVILLVANSVSGAEDLAGRLGDLNPKVLSADERSVAKGMISRDIERRRLAAIARENAAWAQIATRADWEQFSDRRIVALRESLGKPAPAPDDLAITVARRIDGDGFLIENLVFQSRPGLWASANLYLPEPARDSMPGIVISHSHHNPKHEGELQDMGMTWARQGCAVLVMDHLGHGERRQHPFAHDDDYPKPFRRGRQDYYFRSNVGLQLALVGESLMGWMSWDLGRCVDLLVSRPGIDKDQIILVGAVAGGGDPAGVSAALDPRIACVVPFNFGGPQPDDAIPDDAENTFQYFGVAYWEQTRCLRLGGRDGFAHWVVAASVAPRRLIYSHEFGWDREHDPVWPRLEKVFSLYGARDHLAFATGRGTLKGSAPESSHCNNVGALHRRGIYPQFERWLGMVPPDEEYSRRLPAEQLTCLTPDLIAKLKPQPVHQLARDLARRRLEASRARLADLDPPARRKQLRLTWGSILGEIAPQSLPVVVRVREQESADGVRVEHLRLETEPGIVVPVLMLIPKNASAASPAAVVVAFCESGKAEMLTARRVEFARLLDAGIAVCLPDLRGFGESSPGGSVGRGSAMTTLSCRNQVLGQTLVGSRLRDLRSVLRYARSRADTGDGIAVWGDSLAPVNPRDRSEVVPHGADNPNVQSQPEGGLLAMFAALFEDEIDVVYAHGSFASFGFLLDSRFLYAPHASIIPGALAQSDVCDVASALAPRALWVAGTIDGVNKRCSKEKSTAALRPTINTYRAAGAEDHLKLGFAGGVADWTIEQLSK
ncbi:MAG: dienelactone hydrolase [Verrucomicrobiales bacterium]|jgi:dienelactone hydrolase